MQFLFERFLCWTMFCLLDRMVWQLFPLSLDTCRRYEKNGNARKLMPSQLALHCLYSGAWTYSFVGQIRPSLLIKFRWLTEVTSLVHSRTLGGQNQRN